MKLPPPLLENFRYQNSFETQVFSYEFYRHCETKIFQRSLVKNSTERFPPMKFFGTETKIFDGKSWYSPPSSYPYTFSLPEIFWNRAQKGSPMKFFGTVRPKVFDGETWYPSLWCINFLDTRSFPIHRSAPQRNFSVLWDKKVAMEKRDPPFFIHKTFRNQNFYQKE